jgi:hypothetical protein
MDLDKIVNSVYVVESNCDCDSCKKAVKNRIWLKGQFDKYAQEQVEQFIISNGRSEQLCQCEDAPTKHFVKNWCDDCKRHIV